MDTISAFLEYLELEKGYSKYTLSSYSHDIKKFRDFCLKKLNRKIENGVTNKILDLFIASLNQKNINLRSVQRYLSSISSYYNFLIKRDIYDKNPILTYDRGKVSFRKVEPITLDEYDKIISSIDITSNLGKRNYLIFELLFGTGIRVSELVEIKLSDIDLSKNLILIHGKGSKERYVPIHSNLSTLLNDYILYTRNNLLVHELDEEVKYLLINKNSTPLTQRGVQKMLITVVKKASLQVTISPHKLRHLFGTTLLKNGMKIRDIQKLLGHAEITTTQIYVDSEYEELKNKIKEINIRGNNDK